MQVITISITAAYAAFHKRVFQKVVARTHPGWIRQAESGPTGADKGTSSTLAS
jgi:hypothetical protein